MMQHEYNTLYSKLKGITFSLLSYGTICDLSSELQDFNPLPPSSGCAKLFLQARGIQHISKLCCLAAGQGMLVYLYIQIYTCTSIYISRYNVHHPIIYDRY